MIDLTRKSLPNTVRVGGRDYSIYTDFRLWMRFESSLVGCHGKDLIPVAYLFKNEKPAYCDVSELLVFSRPKNELPRKVRGTSDAVLIDFRIDSDLIYAAFMQQYGIDLVDIPELHWHKFLALLNGLKGTKLDDVMGYRCYARQTDKNIDPYEEMREAWAIEEPLTEEELEELDAFNRALGGEQAGLTDPSYLTQN